MGFKMCAASQAAASKRDGVLDLEHRVLGQIKSCFGSSPKSVPPLLLGVSGGLDSLVLLEVLDRMKIVSSLALGHVHHGFSTDANLEAFRNRAQGFVHQLAQSRGLKFYTNSSEAHGAAMEIKSEAALREFRYQWLRRWAQEEGRNLVLAQHSQDLLETRLMRLVRGTGPQGLQAMRPLKDGLFRPLLSISRPELERYAQLRDLCWLEDPSNCNLQPLRNWMRHKWLPELERQRPGAVDALGRSLEQLAQQLDKDSQLDWLYGLTLGETGVRRFALAALSHEAGSIILVEYLRRLSVSSFTAAQLKELLKILDRKQKSFSFEFLGCRWKVNPDWINAHRIG